MVRVVVTGIGMVTPLGLTTQETWEAQLEGKRGLGRITRFDVSGHRVQIGGQIDQDFQTNPRKYLPDLVDKERGINLHHDIIRMHWNTQLGVKAAFEALEQSGLEITDRNRKKIGVYIGTGGGGANEYMDATRTLDDPKKGARRVDPLMSVRVMPNATPGMVAKLVGAKGPSIAVSAACATGNEAIRLAYQEIRLGRCQAMLAGGVEGSLDEAVMATFGNLHALTSKFNDDPNHASRPFDRKRSGFVWSDGSVVMVLENEQYARARGAVPLAYLLGAYATDDAYHETRPAEDAMGSIDAMRGALRQARVRRDQVDLISLHGTSTPENDDKETIAVNQVFGTDLAATIAADPTKSRVGHMIGASGPFSVAMSILTLVTGLVPAHYCLEEKDPKCNLNLCTEVRKLTYRRYAINNNAGFGGHNSSLVVGSVEAVTNR